MDFTFSSDQDALRETVRAFLAERFSRSLVRELAEHDDGFTARQWDEIAEMGWPGLLVPDEQGGLGLGLVDAVVVLEETGRVPLSAPVLSSAVLATLAARRLGLADLLDELAAGARRGTIALEESGAGDPVERVRTAARRKGARWRLTGEKPVVLDGHTADWVLVAARTQDGLGTFLLEEPPTEPVALLDPLRKAARLVLDGTPATPVGPPGDHTPIWRRIADDGAVALAAELVGVADAALAHAIAYAKARVQFDKPIATHQAIQHKIVDMLHRLELGRVGVHYAAWCSDVDDPQRAAAASVAKSAMGDAAVFVTAENIQVHGAVGFTWDDDAHFLYKRAKTDDVLLGSAAWHRSRIAQHVLTPA